MTRIIVMLAIVASILSAAPAQASHRCPGQEPSANRRCVRIVDDRTICAWPVIVNGVRVAYCTRYATETQQ